MVKARVVSKSRQAKQEKIEKKKNTATVKLANSGIKKQYLKSKKTCKVTFRIPKITANSAKSVSIVGDFNNWNDSTHLMKKIRGGDYTATLELEPGKEYQFRYLIDQIRWENDRYADKYVLNPFGSSNSVLVL